VRKQQACPHWDFETKRAANRRRTAAATSLILDARRELSNARKAVRS
jgi:hypothetical protein